MSAEKTSLAKLKKTIAKEVPYVDIKPYSHNIISLALGAIARDFGATKADKAIETFGLEKLGWHKEAASLAIAKLKGSNTKWS